MQNLDINSKQKQRKNELMREKSKLSLFGMNGFVYSWPSFCFRQKILKKILGGIMSFMLVVSFYSAFSPVAKAAVSVPVGSLAFTFNGNYGAGNPIIYLSSTDGSLIGASDEQVLGENTDVLDSGTFTTAFDKIYSYCSIAQTADWSPPTVYSGFKAPRGNYDDRFYVTGTHGFPSQVAIQAVKDDGTLADTWELGSIPGAFGFNISGMVNVAADQNNTVAYYGISGGNGGTDLQQRTVFRYDLVGDAPLSDLAVEAQRKVSTTGYSIMTLRNGEVLVGWSGNSLTSTVVKRYATDGTELATYTLDSGPSSDAIYIESALDDNSFWAGFYDSADYFRIEQIQVSDGAVLKNFEITSAMVDDVNTQFSTQWNPDLGFFITRTDCLLSHTLTVSSAGAGSGTVTSSPIGIDCGIDCTEDYVEGTLVTLTATPNPGSSFSGWSGDCAGTGTCDLTIDADKSATATFIINNPPDDPTNLGPANYTDGSSYSETQPTLTFDLSDPDVADTVKYEIQIDNDSDFSSPVVDYISALQVQGSATFTVGQAEGSGTYITGAAAQTLLDSSYYWQVKAIDEHLAESNYVQASAGVAFVIDTSIVQHNLTVTISGSGSGTVVSAPVGISCGGDCTEDYDEGTFVVLTATASPGSYLLRWTGDCTGAGACVLTMDAGKTVEAIFKKRNLATGNVPQVTPPAPVISPQVAAPNPPPTTGSHTNSTSHGGSSAVNSPEAPLGFGPTEELPGETRTTTPGIKTLHPVVSTASIVREVSKKSMPVFIAIPLLDTLVNLFFLIETGTGLTSLLTYLYLYFLQLARIRKKPKPWGVVYDSATRQPIPFISVHVLDAEGRMLETTVTDPQGRYGFLVINRPLSEQQRQLEFLVQKENYTFPSKTEPSYLDKIVYTNIYQGGVVSVNEAAHNFDLPLDPIKKPSIFNTYFEWARLSNFMVAFINCAFWVGLILVLVNFYYDPRWINLIPLTLWVLALIFRLAEVRLKAFGLVKDKFTKKTLPFSYIMLKNMQGAREAFAVTDQRGRYFLLCKSGKYNLVVYTPSQILPMRTAEQTVEAERGWMTKKLLV